MPRSGRWIKSPSPESGGKLSLRKERQRLFFQLLAIGQTRALEEACRPTFKQGKKQDDQTNTKPRGSFDRRNQFH